MLKSWWEIGFAGEKLQRRYQELRFHEAPSHGALLTFVVKYYLGSRLLIVAIDEEDVHNSQPNIDASDEKGSGVRIVKSQKELPPDSQEIQVVEDSRKLTAADTEFLMKIGLMFDYVKIKDEYVNDQTGG